MKEIEKKEEEKGNKSREGEKVEKRQVLKDSLGHREFLVNPVEAN